MRRPEAATEDIAFSVPNTPAGCPGLLVGAHGVGAHGAHGAYGAYGASSSQTSWASVSSHADACGTRHTVVPAQSVPAAQRHVALGVLQPVSVAQEYLKSAWQ
jgi:hypothetical protein